MKIFLVEDDYFVREDLVKEFKKLDCSIVGEVSDTSEQSFQKAISSKSDLFILDIELERPTAGFEFAKKLRQYDSSIQFAYLTKEEHLYESAHESKEYPKPFEFLDKRDFVSKGMDVILKRLLSKFRAEQAIIIRIAGHKIAADDIVLVEKEENNPILYVYLKNATKLQFSANLKDITDPNSPNYIPNLTKAHAKKLIVNEKYIKRVEREKGKDNPAILHFEFENGEMIKRETAQKEGIHFFRKFN